MKLQIEIHTFVHRATYWLEFDTAEEQRATMTFLDGLTMDLFGSKERRIPFYLIETQEQQDALKRFLSTLARVEPTERLADDVATPD